MPGSKNVEVLALMPLIRADVADFAGHIFDVGSMPKFAQRISGPIQILE